MGKIYLSADSTCDLDGELIRRYDVHIQPLHIILGEKEYRDGVDITPDDIYKTYERENILPKTSAPSPGEYIELFEQWTKEGHDVIHISLGSGISASHQNACLAAEQLGHVHVIDSGNLSTGMGLLVIEAAERIADGLPVAQIAEELRELQSNVQASFIIDNLTYLREGGRCSALTAFGANLLSIKPCIEVDVTSGNMSVGKKYRGSLKKTLKRYVSDKLNEIENLKLDRIFITHSGTDDDTIEVVQSTIKELTNFEEILVTRAGCTISSHCGPNTVGILFMTK